jgi:hypothetical protein
MSQAVSAEAAVAAKASAQVAVNAMTFPIFMIVPLMIDAGSRLADCS